MLRNATKSSSTLGGIVEGLTSKNYNISPSISYIGAPGGLVRHEFFEDIWQRLSADVDHIRPNAIAIEFHGAMGTTELPDAEGELLKRLRRLVGPDMKIAIGLDLHAHLTDDTINNVDVCVACKENPHSDVVECGHKVASLLHRTIIGEIKPVMYMAKVPMVLSGNAETSSGPLFEIHQDARALETQNTQILDISIFNVFPYVDDKDTGQAVLVTFDGGAKNINGIIELADKFWARRHEFIDDLTTVEDGFQKVAANDIDRPFVLSDMGDRVLAGAPGDSTVILQAALFHNEKLKGAISITDPDAVSIAQHAGVGNQITLNVGGKLSPSLSSCMVSGTIVSLSNGEFTILGPFQGGEKSSMGDTAVLLIENRIQLILTSKPAFCHDPGVFTSQGVDISALDFIVVKSGYHFKLNFVNIATPIILRTPGMSYYSPGIFPYKKSKFWPEQDISNSKTKLRKFDRSINS